MLKKLFLTGIFVVSTSVPVLSYGDYITNSSSCDYATLNTYTSANLSAVFEPNNYTITYSCGSAPQGSASTPSSPATSSSSFAMDTPYTLAAAYNCSLPGYTFAGWSCPYLPGTPTLPAGNPQYFAGGANGTYSYAGNITCTAQWTPNNIALHWDSAYTGAPSINDSSCEYDGGITLPTPPPSRTGYTFGGWRVHQCLIDDYPAGDGIDYGWINDENSPNPGYYQNTQYGLNQHGTWAVEFSEGTIRGRAICSSTDGTFAQTGSPDETNGTTYSYCWCAGTSFNNSCQVETLSWVYHGPIPRSTCVDMCASQCASNVMNNSSFRQAIFGVAPSPR